MSKRKGDPGYAPGWCIHYRSNRNTNSPDDDTCEAGVKYSIFRTDNFNTRFAQQPCFLTNNGKSKPNASPCEHLRRPTPEEIAAHEIWLNEHWTKMAVVMSGISEWRKTHRGQSFGEIVECPACKGKLHLSISAYNGHVHGHCETDGCVSWME